MKDSYVYSLERSQKRTLRAVNERRRIAFLWVDVHSPAKRHALLLVKTTNTLLTGIVNRRLPGFVLFCKVAYLSLLQSRLHGALLSQKSVYKAIRFVNRRLKPTSSASCTATAGSLPCCFVTLHDASFCRLDAEFCLAVIPELAGQLFVRCAVEKHTPLFDVAGLLLYGS